MWYDDEKYERTGKNLKNFVSSLESNSWKFRKTSNKSYFASFKKKNRRKRNEKKSKKEYEEEIGKIEWCHCHCQNRCDMYFVCNLHSMYFVACSREKFKRSTTRKTCRIFNASKVIVFSFFFFFFFLQSIFEWYRSNTRMGTIPSRTSPKSMEFILSYIFFPRLKRFPLITHHSWRSRLRAFFTWKSSYYYITFSG